MNLLGRHLVPADLRHDANAFTLLRWFLASSVIFSHSFVLTAVGTDPSHLVLPFSISRLAVLLFFSLSGFLVTGSLIKRGVRDFAIARAVRLLPGLWAMLIVTGALIAVVYPQALGNSDFSRYLIRNAVLLSDAFSIQHVFSANPVSEVVNGSLWTLRQESRCYVALAIVGVSGLLAHRNWLLALFVAALAVHLIVPADAIAALEQPRYLGISFAEGVLLYLWRDRLVLSWPLALAVVAASLALPEGELARTATALSFTYFALVIAICVPRACHKFSAAVPDYSYGIYIYAYPVQQGLIAAGISRQPYLNSLATFVVTLLFAAASWHFVEKPALSLKSRWIRG